jgi:hypothetical protein
MRTGPITAFFAGLLGLMLWQVPAAAQKTDWDRPAAIEDAASRLVTLHRREGSQGVLKFLDACYRTHMLATDYSKGLEGCLAQDYMHSKVLAMVYARVPEHDREKSGAPTAEQIAGSMSQRYSAAFAHYKLTLKDAERLRALIEAHGFPLFAEGVFPKQGRGGGSGKDGGRPGSAPERAPDDGPSQPNGN